MHYSSDTKNHMRTHLKSTRIYSYNKYIRHVMRCNKDAATKHLEYVISDPQTK